VYDFSTQKVHYLLDFLGFYAFLADEIFDGVRFFLWLRSACSGGIKNVHKCYMLQAAVKTLAPHFGPVDAKTRVHLNWPWLYARCLTMVYNLVSISQGPSHAAEGAIVRGLVESNR
jgi:hypothetical protein